MAGHAAGEWAARRAGSGCLEAAAAAAAAARDLPGNSAVVAAQRADKASSPPAGSPCHVPCHVVSPSDRR